MASRMLPLLGRAAHRPAWPCTRGYQATALPDHADTVICGGGILGTSILYHLSELGLAPDTVLLDLGQLGGGITSLAAGIVSMNQLHRAQCKLVRKSQVLYRQLTAAGHDIGLEECGGLHLARSWERLQQYHRLTALSESLSTEFCMLTPDEVKGRCPLLHTADLKGGLWIPSDVAASPLKLTQTLARLAQQKGATVLERVRVQRVLTDGRRVTGVETDVGTIHCNRFVNVAGYWSHDLGKLSSPMVKVPVHPCEHYFLVTRPVAALPGCVPSVVDPDGRIYVRAKEGCLVAGGFEENAKPAFGDMEHLPVRFESETLQPDWDHFYGLLHEIVQRVPAVGEAVLDQLISSPETYSPDGQWIMGESPEVENYFVTAGLGASGTAAAGGVGRIMAHWMVHGEPHLDVFEMDVRRFLALHNNRTFLRTRIHEVPGQCMRIPWTFPEYRSGRRLRTSPIFPRMKDAGARFGAVMGYERPAYFESSADAGPDRRRGEFAIAVTDSFSKPRWFDNVEEEYNACRERVAVSDYSSFTKIDLMSKGDEVVHLLQYLCSNDVNVPVGNILHTGMQNQHGGYENDCSLARIAHNHYMMICPTIQHGRSRSWLQRHAPADGSVVISDITSLYTALCVMGPLARELLSEITDHDLSPKSFPFFTFKEIDVGMIADVRAMNMTHTGELGWVLYIPNEYALYVYDLLMERGQDYGLALAGYLAMRSLRVEKFYAFWGQDLGTTTTPLECGRAFRVKFNRDVNFIGREALLRQRAEGVRRLYVHFTVQDHDPETDPWAWGHEPILRDGEYAGLVTTSAFGYSLGKLVCLGFVQDLSAGQAAVVNSDYVLRGHYQINIGGRLFPAKPSLVSPSLPTKYQEPTQKRYQATQHTWGGRG
ncbi:pyruvate dehydrogenase phosphatase regulatory subunit, mitochondrial-like [Pollicipes pollicipes]|uniref:pyruvate dehydrogenase phosphatase regulatory subunit, mitochondrial-like n=1 Tax=Pollicipes pollicipes TaxID=41117 RepID=UPI001885932C|nr:pyruvate dehydrogenase phosphatase regulatory subunit, mitochondrial-like [Pollicipes pollicipes]XP_037089303.1 pyruvate dehydrogenase phosphatase regulatory subunit, mitochondrial-like [Pollicipes pollicipes]XP_037089304.1 pyruvate dehydrogenase phosphatase regulatory subunit, mitochondrial-like [Pollicipes pollicipes]XP_037089305.1 pyruvate dehydrogenase phosphatase regulatory subunit, mitochondrial-like [Pollicipes pollicipes]